MPRSNLVEYIFNRRRPSRPPLCLGAEGAGDAVKDLTGYRRRPVGVVGAWRPGIEGCTEKV